MSDKSKGEHYCAAGREIGVLITVFGPLDLMFDSKFKDWPLAWRVLWCVVLGVILIWLFTEIEGKKK